MDPVKRFDLAKNKRLCYNCLKSGHSSAACKAESTCKATGCKLKHTKFLHAQKTSSETAISQRTKAAASGLKTEEASCSYVRTSSPRVALQVVKVKVTAKYGRSADAYALLDSGSTNTFCSTSLLQKLGSH